MARKRIRKYIKLGKKKLYVHNIDKKGFQEGNLNTQKNVLSYLSKSMYSGNYCNCMKFSQGRSVKTIRN